MLRSVQSGLHMSKSTIAFLWVPLNMSRVWHMLLFPGFPANTLTSASACSSPSVWYIPSSLSHLPDSLSLLRSQVNCSSFKDEFPDPDFGWFRGFVFNFVCFSSHFAFSMWHVANYVFISSEDCLIPLPHYTIHHLHAGVMNISFSLLSPGPGTVMNT